MEPNRKKIATIALALPAGRAAPSPILGQALGQYGLNIAGFCKIFNEKTKNVKAQVTVPVRVEVYRLRANSQNTFEVTTKSPSSTYLLKQTIGIIKGSPTPGHHLGTDSQGTSGTKKRGWFVTLREIYHLAIFRAGPQAQIGKGACKTLIGSAKSIGLILRGR